ncbi:MAG: S8 family serine peptidase [Phyllobacteriaceae bacterium]|nr:S8 family serine peptidase [Phyllobacteriaceae bacterium]
MSKQMPLSVEARAASYGELKTMRQTEARSERGRRHRGLLREIAGDLGRADAPVRVLATPERETPVTGATVIEGEAKVAAALANALEDHEVVEDMTIDLIEPIPWGDVLATASSPTIDADLWHLEKIGLAKARQNGFALDGSGVTVGVLDTGVAEVPELQRRITSSVTLNLETWNGDPQSPSIDSLATGHGTAVACLIAGKTIGVAPGASIAAVTMLPDAGRGSLSEFVIAMEYVGANTEIRILNMSAGKHGFEPRMRLLAGMIRRANVLAVVAVGNEGENTSRSPGNYPEVISVGASNRKDHVWASSGGGMLVIDDMQHTVPTLVAPGEAVCAISPVGNYWTSSGSSLATPIVSGVAALLLQEDPSLTAAALRKKLIDSCHNLGVPKERQGYGRVQL